jgi:glycosyltransferase involved in cell wall biosynthesis
MLLIDTIYIHNGGGKILLDYLIEKLEATETKCFYLFDNRSKNLPAIKSTNQVLFLKPSLWRRFMFYKKHKTLFSKVFCLGNLPPNIKLKAEVFNYYHSHLYLKNPIDFSTIERVQYALKRQVLKRFSKNTDFWLVQTSLMKQKLGVKFKIDASKVRLVPFYPPFDIINNMALREVHTFLYVSNATSHKNHMRLIDAFCAFYDEYAIGKLILTVSDEEQYQGVYSSIQQRILKGYPIVNVGFVGRQELQTLYLSSEYLIFPSLAESFGLGLVEAINNGCKVIGADLAYTYAVCEPSITFNPHKVELITQAFKEAIRPNVKNSKSIMHNQIDDLVHLLN